MAAAPQYGQFVFQGLSTGKSFTIDMYASDVANARVNLDGGAGASSTSPTYWMPPEDVVLKDVFIHTGMTDTTKIRILSNSRPTLHTLRYAAQLDTSNARPELNIKFFANTQIAAIQLA